MYHETLWRVDQEAMLGYETRNGIINRGADLWVATKDLQRNLSIDYDRADRIKMLRGYLMHYVPAALDLLPG